LRLIVAATLETPTLPGGNAPVITTTSSAGSATGSYYHCDNCLHNFNDVNHP
jgi:hypothetical protein